ncbi:MAG: hypothetical protein E7316_01335 [Clostridiales bacterium]|nr:hypothetical protein [Clostridiales bacterium]
MKTYAQIVREYKKRRRDTVADAIAAGLTYMDELAVDAGVLEETGLLQELGGSVCGALPFVSIAAMEGAKVLLGRKPGVTGLKDGACRMVKTGAAMGVGSAVASAAGPWAAIPVSVGVRVLFDRYRSAALTGLRVRGRIDRLKELNAFLRREDAVNKPEAVVRLE